LLFTEKNINILNNFDILFMLWNTYDILWLRSTWCYECFEAFFDWLFYKILSSDWSIECFEAFV